MKIANYDLGKFLYNASTLITLGGGICIGDGLGEIVSRCSDARGWIELAGGLLFTAGSIIYKCRNGERYDPTMSRLRLKINESERQIQKYWIQN
jgi:hypothetical protein